jgi:hypothetical protein
MQPTHLEELAVTKARQFRHHPKPDLKKADKNHPPAHDNWDAKLQDAKGHVNIPLSKRAGGRGGRAQECEGYAEDGGASADVALLKIILCAQVRRGCHQVAPPNTISPPAHPPTHHPMPTYAPSRRGVPRSA